MKKAGLLESPSRGFFKITDRGLEVLSRKPSKIDLKFLLQFEEFVEFKTKHKDSNKETIHQTTIEETLDPMEALENAFSKIKNNLADDLLKEIKTTSPTFFEKAVLQLLSKMGYGDLVEHTGKTGDEGIDGKIREDKLGLEVIYVQAKRWANGTVGRPEIHKFIGALSSQGANKGIFITTSSFSSDALECGLKSIAKNCVN